MLQLLTLPRLTDRNKVPAWMEANRCSPIMGRACNGCVKGGTVAKCPGVPVAPKALPTAPCCRRPGAADAAFHPS